MEPHGAKQPVRDGSTTTAMPWDSAFSLWFSFTYRPPAVLVGWEARMR